MVNTFLQLIILLHAMRLNNLVGGGENFFKVLKFLHPKFPCLSNLPCLSHKILSQKAKCPGTEGKTPALPFLTDIEHANEGVQWSLHSGDTPGTKISVP